MIGPKDRLLHTVVPRRDRAQALLHRIDLADITARQHRQRAEADGAAQEATTIDVLNELAIFSKHALIDRRARPKQRRSPGANGHGFAPSVCRFVSAAVSSPAR